MRNMQMEIGVVVPCNSLTFVICIDFFVKILSNFRCHGIVICVTQDAVVKDVVLWKKIRLFFWSSVVIFFVIFVILCFVLCKRETSKVRGVTLQA